MRRLSYCLRTQNLLKTNSVTNLDLDPAKWQIELAREGTLSLGLSIKSIVNYGIAGKWVVTKTHQVSLADNREYFDLLDDAQARPVLRLDGQICLPRCGAKFGFAYSPYILGTAFSSAAP
jgi:hypothetical protein